ncbi:S41 family peptidase [Candidatus Viridilinea mediisalina]|uniref:Carboxyl-terminal protease n=1 Tax=Candidatus Viridilinea mediisalina TaxID=2024553 RepID=A0A2A6RM46_9CHLR|nr:S41 family peptidase [Candidatus Viridilinea mediisalina]PDW04142.1 carboxyl-terminal protease [Candidatus Viridilinea mediisalina]
MVRIRHALIVGVVALVIVGTLAFSGGWVAARNFGTTPVDSLIASVRLMGARQETPTEVRDEFAVFWQVWSIVEGEFYRPAPLDRQRMVYGAIRGMLAALEDEYTTFQEPEVAAVSRESMQGRFEGIGAYLRYEAGEILIHRPFRRSPAEQAGLLTGDVILAVDGTPMAQIIEDLSEGEAIAAAAEQIRGPKGSVVTLTLRREQVAEPFDVAITRDEVPVITVNAELLDNGVAYIQITEFKASTTELLDETLRELIPQQPQSIVLDLRNNSGGFLQTAREVLGRFYTGVALYEHENGGVVKELSTISGPADTQLFDIPMVVLVNAGSASAAEIVAGALRDMRPNTTLLGEQTFGKGSVQNIHQLRDGSSARITVAHWHTPNGTAINRVGLIPEHIVAASDDIAYTVPCIADRRPAEGQEHCGDAQLAWGLRLLNGNPPPPAPQTGA